MIPRSGTMDNTAHGNLSCAFDAERIAACAAANATFMADTMMPGPVSIPKLQQLVVMYLAYVHAWHLRWEDKEPGHLGSATARSSNDDAPA